jgi:alpha-tubulin suppressor-like RCC1 family protein
MGRLGLGPSFNNAVYATPQLMTFPENVSIKQLNCNLAAHFLALDCGGTVWAWGDNNYGQVGNGSINNIGTTPNRVLASDAIELPNKIFLNGKYYLTDVKEVHAGATASFAILSNGKLVSWGSNDSNGNGNGIGKLGDGTTVNRYSAVYVVDGATRRPLEGVVQVAASDQVTYVLVDKDGDGKGTVYSFGNGEEGLLGRNAIGTSNPNNNTTVQSSFAYPVISSNAPLSNITTIAAGSVFGMALDANHYIWTWGRAAWNNSTGATIIPKSHSEPKKVLAGNTTGASNDGEYLLAKSIAGGRSVGLAVSIDDKPVAWGGSGECAGGFTGVGNTTPAIVPTYIQFGTGLVHYNVIYIYAGTGGGFYSTSNKKIYAWGCNTSGQLGIGNTTNQLRAVEVTTLATLKMRDPAPIATFAKRSLTVCEVELESGITLNSGFIIDNPYSSSYSITWYRDDVEVSSGNMSNTNAYLATEPGKYKVTLTYDDDNVCMQYKTSSDSINIILREAPFEREEILNCDNGCSPNAANLHLVSNDITAQFGWYKESNSTTTLGTTDMDNSICINTGLLLQTGTEPKKWKVYVQEEGIKKINFVNANDNTADTTVVNYGSIFDSKLNFTVFNSFTLNSIVVGLNSFSPMMTATIEIRNTANNNLVKTVTTQAMGANGNVKLVVNFDNLQLPIGKYSISVTNGAMGLYFTKPGDAYKIYSFKETPLLSFTGTGYDGNETNKIPYFRQWNISYKSVEVCRYPVVIDECYCNYSLPVVTMNPTGSITADPAELIDGIELNSGLNIDMNFAEMYNIVWYKDNEVLVSGTADLYSKITVYETGDYKVDILFSNNAIRCQDQETATGSVSIVESVLTSTLANSGSKITLFPNPTQGAVNLEFKNWSDNNIDVIVFDLSGKKVAQYKLQSSNDKLTFGQDLNQGFYTIKVVGNKETEVLNFIKK